MIVLFFLHDLRDPAVPTMASVEVLFQSAAVLRDPSDYWISVINAGRALKVCARPTNDAWGSLTALFLLPLSSTPPCGR